MDFLEGFLEGRGYEARALELSKMGQVTRLSPSLTENSTPDWRLAARTAIEDHLFCYLGRCYVVRHRDPMGLARAIAR